MEQNVSVGEKLQVLQGFKEDRDPVRCTGMREGFSKGLAGQKFRDYLEKQN